MENLVSVCLAIRNEADYIENCINSVVDQSYKNVEIIIADGMSTDGTPEIVSRLVEESPGIHIKLIENPEVRPDYGFNLAINYSAGSYIMLLGGHAELNRHNIETALKTLNATGTDVVGGLVEAKGTNPASALIAALLSSPFGTGAKFRFSHKSEFLETVGFGLYKKSLFQEFGLLDTTLPMLEDLEYNRKLVAAGKKIFFNPDIKSSYFCRSKISDFINKTFFTGTGIALHFIRNRNSVSHRHLAPASTLLLIAVLFASASKFLLPKLALALIITTYMITDLYFSLKSTHGKPVSWAALFVFFPIYHVSYGLGTLTGLTLKLFNPFFSGRIYEKK